MKKIIISQEVIETIPLEEINDRQPIFAKRKGKLVGMCVKEDEGWILKIGGNSGSDGHHETLRKLMESNHRDFGTEFFQEK